MTRTLSPHRQRHRGNALPTWLARISRETEFLFEPTEFLRKLAALIPPPRTHHVRYFGVFASRANDPHRVRALVPPSLDSAAVDVTV